MKITYFDNIYNKYDNSEILGSDLYLFPKRILQPHRQIKHRFPHHRIHPVSDEVAVALELELVVGLCAYQRWLDDGLDGFQAVGVEASQEVFAAGVWVFVGEQAVIEADFSAQAVCNGHPGDDAFDLDAGGAGGAAFGVRYDRGLHFCHVTCSVFAEAGAFNHVAVFQAHFVADEQAEETFGWRFFKIGALYPHLFAQLEVAVAQLGVVRVNGGSAGV